ncbi:unknown [Alistipes sp. CAG:435]|nr:unknown [Alistipes sp. CAG:435]
MSKTNTLSTDSRKGLNTVPEKRPGHRHSTP